MNKSMILFVTTILMLSLGACGTSASAPFGPSKESSAYEESTEGTALNAEGDGWSIQTNGDYLKLTIDANHSTGYRWVVDDAGSEMFEVESDKYVEDEHEEGMTGVGGTETFTINILQSGTGGLTFEYKQNWDGGESDGKYDLNVTATEENGKPVITDADFTKMKGGTDDAATMQNTDRIASE